MVCYSVKESSAPFSLFEYHTRTYGTYKSTILGPRLGRCALHR